MSHLPWLTVKSFKDKHLQYQQVCIWHSALVDLNSRFPHVGLNQCSLAVLPSLLDFSSCRRKCGKKLISALHTQIRSSILRHMLQLQSVLIHVLDLFLTDMSGHYDSKVKLYLIMSAS